MSCRDEMCWLALVKSEENCRLLYTFFLLHEFLHPNFVYKEVDFAHSPHSAAATLQANALNDHTSSTHKASPTTATTTAMAQLPPEDVATMPTQKVVFNAPFDNKATYYMRVINPGTKRIGYAFKTTKPKRINMNPPNGVLGPKESVNVAVSCDAFDPGSEDTKGDRVTVEWTNTPDPAATAFKLEWFQGDGMVRRKNLPIEYNV
ncbi:hypothetical protein niasHT_023464 [Heterodera trifolii]|uniref:Major sperm protein n=1 Tax=Heterodera trifolii TaxID=157864 RepID=A0ABD2JJ23_9BILA